MGTVSRYLAYKHSLGPKYRQGMEAMADYLHDIDKVSADTRVPFEDVPDLLAEVDEMANCITYHLQEVKEGKAKLELINSTSYRESLAFTRWLRRNLGFSEY
jgi:hypothetical protein